MFESLLQFLNQWINLVYLISFLTLSYTLRDVSKNILKAIGKKITKKDVVIKNVYVVLIIAFLLAIPFYLFEPCKECLMKIFMTYCVGTSIYEIFIKVFANFVTNFFKTLGATSEEK